MKKIIFISFAILSAFLGITNTYAQEDNKLTCDNVWKIVGTADCPAWAVNTDLGGIWCDIQSLDIAPWTKGVAPKYTFTPGTCNVEEEEEADQPQKKETKEVEISKDVKPLDVKLFGVNPFQTWLNLKGLTEAWGYMQTNEFQDTIEWSWSPGKRARVRKEVEWNEKMAAYEKYIEESQTRFSELSTSEKQQLERVIKTTGKSIFIEQNPATLQLQPINGQPGILNPQGPTLESGALDVKVEPQSGQQFQLQTPNSDIFVIGTEFSIIYDPQKSQTIVAVYKGQVEVKIKNGSKRLATPTGDEPGIVIVAQKLSVTKLVLTSLMLAAIIGGIIFFLKRKKQK